MHWIIEDFSNSQRNVIVDAMTRQCEKDGVLVSKVKLIPFEHTVVGGDPLVQGDVIFYGSTAMKKLHTRIGGSPGIFPIINEKETFEVLGELYLNSDMRVLGRHEVLPYMEKVKSEFFFIKPNTDTKSFDGTVVDINRYNYFMENVSQYENFDDEVKICVSSVKSILKEWRVFVFDKHIIGASQYRKEMKLNVKEGIDSGALEFVECVIKTFDPSIGYVIDVCETSSGEYKVIEYNTLNHSGMYACNPCEIVKHINDYYIKGN